VCMCGFFNVWMFVCVGFVMCGCVYVWVLYCVGFVMCGCVCVCGCFGNMCSCFYCVLYSLYFFYCFVSVYLFLFVQSVLVYGLLPPSENSITVNNNNNNYYYYHYNSFSSNT